MNRTSWYAIFGIIAASIYYSWQYLNNNYKNVLNNLMNSSDLYKRLIQNVINEPLIKNSLNNYAINQMNKLDGENNNSDSNSNSDSDSGSEWSYESISSTEEVDNLPDNQIRKTSDEWYRDDRTADLVDARGWNDLVDPMRYWMTKKILFEEYQTRRAKSIALEYGDRDHISPFDN